MVGSVDLRPKSTSTITIERLVIVMAHKHAVNDVNKRFVIEGATRIITGPEDDLPILIQYDHNSEHITFEADRMVEGHDLSVCDKVEIHYNNVSKSGSRHTSKGVYKAVDLAVDSKDDTKVTFTWIVSKNATQYEGVLGFVVAFTCLEGEEIVYRWNTKVNNTLFVSASIDNSEVVTETYADVLEMWKDMLFGIGDTEEASMLALGEAQRDAIATLGEEMTAHTEKCKDFLVEEAGVITEESKASLVEKANQLLATIPDTSEKLQSTVNELIEGQYIPKTTIDGNTITETYNDGHKRVTTIDGNIVTENWYTTDGVLTKTNVITISQNGVTETLTTV